ncbi:D-2-hydroxyacid dehydrogenase [Herbiconiux sp. 11R-BC]|uniref:D-2-hydroxyacid dehydrogenase n=1 Tax=Herbiconiux sp. 11R-BC TaxID=3111637 RepID=UPI003C03B0B2
MTSNPSSLRVVAATPIERELVDLITAREPRIEFVWEPELLHPQRFPGDHAGDPAFERTPAQQARFESLLDSAEALYGVPDERPPLLKRVADANPRLRWVQTMPAGGGAQVKAAGLSDGQLQRIAFSTSAGVHSEPLAEYALFGLFAGAKSLPRLLEQQRRHEWGDRWTMGLISEQRILVVGLGSIGRATARKLSALGAHVTGTSRHESAVENVDVVVHPDQIARVAPELDGVVVTLPGTAATENLVGREFFESLKPGASFVSVGRGTVVDEEALIAALRSGRVGFAALDVFASEPLAPDSPLWDDPRVVISPHTAALNSAEDRLIAELFAENATRLLDGAELINRVDTVEFY